MPVRTFDDWAAARAQTLPLSALKDAVIGVEASHYLSCHLFRQPLTNPPATQEPLLAALGGHPLELKSRIEDDLEKLQAAGVTPIFIFSGMDIARKEKFPPGLVESMRENARAWDMYGESDRALANESIQVFRSSGSIKPQGLFRFLQQILYAHNVKFMVAPYSACAQLAYLDQHPRQFVDAIWGSSELFLFEVPKVITKVDHAQSEFTWISRAACQDELGKVSADVFVDAYLLSGSSFLPTFPILENPTIHRKPFNFRDAVNLLLSMGRSVTAVCTHYQDDPQVQQMDYLDRFRRAKMAIKHHVILTDDGKIEPLDVAHAPSDVHEFIGQRLPEELYFYMSKGVLGPRVPNSLTSGELLETPPLDNGETEDYHRLVRSQLNPMRAQALSLLSQPLYRFYHRKDVTLRFWFDRDAEQTLSFKDIVPPPRDLVASWSVRDNAIKESQAKTSTPPGTLGFAIRALTDGSFAAKTVTSKPSSKPLVSKDEVLNNTLWRFLQLRGFVDEQHSLTPWGKALQAAISALDPADNLEEEILVAIEMLRLNLLKADTIFSKHVGDPLHGSEQDKQNCLLLSRVACFGKLSYKPAGYAGPLSRNFLGFNSFISAVRSSLRDLVEITLANLFLNGDADRDRKDWTDLGLALPFLDDPDYGLGIAMKMYLDEVAQYPIDNNTAADASARKEMKIKGNRDWFPEVNDLPGDLEKGFRLFDAIFQAVKVAGKEVTNGDRWVQAESWLADRR
ncbi:MAG: hypothetical protein M4579_002518 [Chaenotheca gracillima]|nr:MAG: hypothetical protein M4579_002518 [Chaenotheca gracillima]